MPREKEVVLPCDSGGGGGHREAGIKRGRKTCSRWQVMVCKCHGELCVLVEIKQFI